MKRLLSTLLCLILLLSGCGKTDTGLQVAYERVQSFIDTYDRYGDLSCSYDENTKH